jgi:thioesterase domain-containing protein/acyl carrier protein
VKIRGYRIELGEISAAINKQREVKESVVILREDNPNEKILMAYVVLDSESSKDTETESILSDLKKRLKKTLPDYMIPSNWMVLPRLPLTANNKIDKKNLPKPSHPGKVRIKPTSSHETLVAKIWGEALKKEVLDVKADFFEIGGHSLMAVKVVSKLERETGRKIPLNALFNHPVLSDFAKYLDTVAPNEDGWSSLVPIKKTGAKPPLYLVHGIGSTVSIFFNLAKFIEDDQPVYGFQPVGLNGTDKPHGSLEEMAAHYVSLMLENNPDGPHLIGGYSFGGYVAFEMARQMHAMGKQAEKLIIFDTPAYPNPQQTSKWEKLVFNVKEKITDYLFFSIREPHGFLENKKRSLDRKYEKLLRRLRLVTKFDPQSQDEVLKSVMANNKKILDNYHLKHFPGTVYLFRAPYRSFYVEDKLTYGWQNYIEEVIVVPVTGHHDNFFKEPKHLKVISEQLKKTMESPISS